MDLLLHQIIIFTLTAIYFPLIMAEFVAIVTDKNLSSRVGYCGVLIILIATFPKVIKNYQQHLMGHFSDLPELITTGQTISNTMTVVIVLFIMCFLIGVTIKFRKMKG